MSTHDGVVAMLDTDVFSAVIVDPVGAKKRGRPVDQWRRQLTGLHIVIAFQTRVELEIGFRLSNWGPSRLQEARELVGGIPVIQADNDVQASFAQLTIACRSDGHALHAKPHCADRWIAAAAIAKNIPLLSGDAIYHGAPGLQLLE